MQVECISPCKGDVVSRIVVSVDVKDVFNFGEHISREVVKQLSDIIADDLVARKAEEILNLVDMNVVARGIEHRIINTVGDEISKVIVNNSMIGLAKSPLDLVSYNLCGVGK